MHKTKHYHPKTSTIYEMVPSSHGTGNMEEVLAHHTTAIRAGNGERPFIHTIHLMPVANKHYGSMS